MASLDLDPMFRRGLRLLHSRSRDSVDQLKAIVDEVVRQRQGKTIPSMNKDPFSLRRESPNPRSKPGSPIPVPLSKREEIKKDMERKLSMRDEDMVMPKRPRLDSPSAFKSHTPSPTPSIKSESSSRSRKSDESESDTEMNDLAMEMMDEINCIVCKSFEVSPRNRLVECQECHTLYHQECHKPPVTDQDVNDPRLMWYCAKCTKTLKKQCQVAPEALAEPALPLPVRRSRSPRGATRGGGPPKGDVYKNTALLSSSGSGSTSGSRSSGSGNLSNTGGSGGGKAAGAPHTRPAPSPTKGPNLPRPSPFANLSSASGRSLGSNNSGGNNNGNSKISLSSSSSSAAAAAAGKLSAPNAMISAEKRMQQMKKKAAKMAEKRKL